ncbi:MAG: LPS export ABC transporter periplasmic protein LptC [Muribaculaceae bacterium]|nr:LPS export ABC transporter periplasmic protein LptC [Muribaculaceae bacterium]
MRPVVTLTLALLTLAACKDGEVKSVVDHATDPDHVPTMATNDVQTIISDEGHTRYRITAKRWLMFEEARKPHWIFPQGVQAEELDSAYAIITTIKCDSAYYDKGSTLWDLHGNVRITNENGDVILTDQLFWNQGKHTLYSDAFIHIEKQGRIIEGYGYESNEKFTTYQLRRVEAIFPIDESRMPHPGSGAMPPAP